nr:hypothetical protein [Tanacetum cinerariifolium]
MSAKRTSWNEFSSAMASTVICLSTGGDTKEHVQDVTDGDAAQGDDTAAYGEVPTVSQEPSIPSPTPPTPPPPPQPPQDIPSTSQRVDTLEDNVMDDASNQERIIDELDKDDDAALMDDKEEDKKEEEDKVVENDQEDEPAEVQEVVDVVTTAHCCCSKQKKERSEEPKPLKKKQQIEMDEEYARKLHTELNKDIDWDVAIDHVNLKAKEDPTTKEQMKEEESRALQSINETPAQKAAKKRKLNKENFDREDLEALWSLVKERFSTSKPKNFFDDFLLTTLGAMFEKPD